eukprot:7184884-Ditylum_brightwellii.AAC.1
MEGGRPKGKKKKEEECKRVKGEVEQFYTVDQCSGVERSTLCLNQWLTVVPNVANNSILGKDKFRDIVLLWYKIVPKDLPKVCDGCDKQHTFQHTLQCKKGGLIGACHDKARDDLGLTATQAYPQDTPDPVVSIIMLKDKAKDPNLYGDLLICSLWKPQTNAIIDVHITNTDIKSYISRLLQSVLTAHEKEKKAKYLQHYLDQHCHFSPFV